MKNQCQAKVFKALQVEKISSLSRIPFIEVLPIAMLPIISDSATNLVAWYDFSDGTTMFENAAGSDPAEDGDRIQNVTNKAWDGLGSSSVSLNKYIGQPSLTSTDQPVWTKSVGLAPGYLTFTGSEELYSSILIGNVSNNIYIYISVAN